MSTEQPTRKPRTEARAVRIAHLLAHLAERPTLTEPPAAARYQAKARNAHAAAAALIAWNAPDDLTADGASRAALAAYPHGWDTNKPAAALAAEGRAYAHTYAEARRKNAARDAARTEHKHEAAADSGLSTRAGTAPADHAARWTHRDTLEHAAAAIVGPEHAPAALAPLLAAVVPPARNAAPGERLSAARRAARIEANDRRAARRLARALADPDAAPLARAWQAFRTLCHRFTNDAHKVPPLAWNDPQRLGYGAAPTSGPASPAVHAYPDRPPHALTLASGPARIHGATDATAALVLADRYALPPYTPTAAERTGERQQAARDRAAQPVKKPNTRKQKRTGGVGTPTITEGPAAAYGLRLAPLTDAERAALARYSRRALPAPPLPFPRPASTDGPTVPIRYPAPLPTEQHATEPHPEHAAHLAAMRAQTTAHLAALAARWQDSETRAAARALATADAPALPVGQITPEQARALNKPAPAPAPGSSETPTRTHGAPRPLPEHAWTPAPDAPEYAARLIALGLDPARAYRIAALAYAD